MFDVFGTPIIYGFHNEAHKAFSNFSPHRVVVWDLEFDTSEHAYQWAKTLIPEEKRRVLIKSLGFDSNGPIERSTTAGEAKREGKLVTKRPDWEEVRFDIMVEILRAKFRQNRDAQKVLLSTEDAILIEGNTWHDNIWGDCSCGDRPECKTPGLNLLGKALMLVRKELQDELW